MRKVKVSAYYPHHETESFGFLGSDDALTKFDEFPWEELVLKARDLEVLGESCVSADLTYLVDDCHLTTRNTDDPRLYDIEAVIPRSRKILGLFAWPISFEIKNLTADETRKALIAFLKGSRADQLSYLSQLRSSSRTKA